MKLYGDGWYVDKEDAYAMVDMLNETPGIQVIGMVHTDHHTWGFLYWADKPFTPNHDTRDPGHPFHHSHFTEIP